MPSPVPERNSRYAASILMSPPGAPALLGIDDDLAGLRVLVLGNAVTETLCALMHTECRQAETRTPGCQTTAFSAELVLVPRLTRENVDSVINQAAHALCQNGRIVIATAGKGPELLAHCAMMLLGAGFDLPVAAGENDLRTMSATRGVHPGRA